MSLHHVRRFYPTYRRVAFPRHHPALRFSGFGRATTCTLTNQSARICLGESGTSRPFGEGRPAVVRLMTSSVWNTGKSRLPNDYFRSHHL